MSMDVGGAKGGIKSDINVTPLVDVMLVLLIIMMIVAPLLQKGAPVRLPTAANSADKPETQDQTVVAVTANGEYYVNGVPIPDSELRRRVDGDSREQDREDRADQGRRGRAVRQGDGSDGRAPRRRHRGHGPHHRAPRPARPGGGGN